MQNIREKDVGATFAYDADGKLAVAKMASYDRIGRKTRQWVIYTMPGMPAVELSYEYNQSDELIHSTFGEWDASASAFVPRAGRYRNYDAAGRLLKIEDENHKNIATYVYTKNGNVKSKSYYDKGVLVYKKTIIRDVHDRPKKIVYEDDSKLLFQDTIDYVTPLAGRIFKVEHTWKGLPGRGDVVRSVNYKYDADGRLIKANGALSGEYAYEGPYGQMTRKKEGDTTVNYTYSNRDKYRPSGFNVNGSSPSGTEEYFLYDAAGNAWLDRHVNVAYRLNSAGLPEAAYALSATAAEPTLDQVNSGNVADVSQTMYMAYDEGGQRIWTAFRGAGVDEEFATMPGVGKYYAQHVSNDVGFTLTQMDLVAGGFRDMNSGIAYYPVTDMQGNVRAYASTGGLNGAIDYYAYGTSSEIVHGNVEDNKRWQGKEEDGSIRKLYFGSRYFDPFFGMWLTPDPAGQFANPYTYGGDPVNYVDPNGEFVHVLVGAVVGAVVGTVNGAIQCTAPGSNSRCGASVSIGFFGGAAVGAAAAATGGAATGLAGLGLQSAAAGAVVGGAVGGAVGSAGQYATNYAQQKVSGLDPKWDSSEFWTGVGIGAGLGALTAGLQYGLVDRYALEVDRTVAEWGNRLDMLDRAAKAVGSSGNYDVAMGGWFANTQSGTTDYNPVTDGTTLGQSNYDPTLNKVTLYNDDFMVKVGNEMKFDPDRFLYAAKHETMHYELTEKAIAMSTTPDLERNLDKGAFMNKYGMPQETITKDISNYRYGRYWSPELKNTINNSLDEQWQYIRQNSLQKNTDQFRALLGYEVVNEY